MKGLFTRSLAEAWRATSLAPAARPVRKLTRSQYVLACLLWVALTPFLLLAFVLLGERPRAAKA